MTFLTNKVGLSALCSIFSLAHFYPSCYPLRIRSNNKNKDFLASQKAKIKVCPRNKDNIFLPSQLVSSFFSDKLNFSDCGAGGEKVLWAAVSAVQRAKTIGKKDSKIQIHIYSGSKLSAKDILEQKVHQRFGIEIDKTNLSFI